MFWRVREGLQLNWKKIGTKQHRGVKIVLLFAGARLLNTTPCVQCFLELGICPKADDVFENIDLAACGGLKVTVRKGMEKAQDGGDDDERDSEENGGQYDECAPAHLAVTQQEAAGGRDALQHISGQNSVPVGGRRR